MLRKSNSYYKHLIGINTFSARTNKPRRQNTSALALPNADVRFQGLNYSSMTYLKHVKLHCFFALLLLKFQFNTCAALSFWRH